MPLDIVPVSSTADSSSAPMVFDIAMGVRKGDRELKGLLEKAVREHRREVRDVLLKFGIPLVEESNSKTGEREKSD